MSCVPTTMLCAALALLALPVDASQGEPPHPHGSFEENCSLCHTSEGWRPAVIDPAFDHARYGFDLDGAHTRTLCRSCHVSLEFDKADSNCISCHSDVHRGELGVDCGTCHTTSSFIDRADEMRSHRMTRFPLTGSHRGLGCDDCHPLAAQGGLRFLGTPVDCSGCHMEQFHTTTNPNHAALGFDRDCTQCHATTTWTQGDFSSFDHAQTGFPLSGAHRTLDCTDCHVGNQFGGTAAECVACHQQDYQATTQPDHVAGGLPTTCQDCHTSSAWSPADFDHSLTAFALTGSHTGVSCEQCHTGGDYAAASTDCASCHLADYQQAPGHVASNFPMECQNCHSTLTWAGGSFNHDFFPFAGGHSGVDCVQCHTTGTFATIPADCSSCHLDDYQQAPGHVASSFPQTCEDCHTITTWANATFDHDAFPLAGGHGGVDCVQCHTSGTFASMPSECLFCHQPDYVQAPGHVSSNFAQTCEDCHTVTTWANATFDHDFFPLSGGHTGVDCVACHTTGVYGTIPADCVSCHLTDYQQAQGHATFPQTCDDCHDTTTWANATFDHDFFPLSGGHTAVDCVVCHTSGVYGTIPADCVSCHLPDYQQATGHATFPQTCDDCHDTTLWSNANFDHSFFPLSGGHTGLNCVTCHTTGVYEAVPADCVSCHQPDYQQAPGHVASNFAQTCEDCHTVTTWANATFDHDFFPLAGGHGGVDCVQCHTSGTFASMPSDCLFCHQPDYVQAPGHVSGNFPQTCEDCHTVTTWANATFDHDFFPLSGGHTGVDCVTCHTTGVYGTIPADCVACHLADYQQAPGHATFPQTCEDCHDTTLWTNATFDHDFFPLNAGHNGLNCVDCHTTGVYGTIPADCIACHLPDYQQAPDHQSLAFPQDCEDCHETTTWSDTSNFVHTVELRGPHNEPCSACHLGTVQDFSCLGACHYHTVNREDNRHQGESGYFYDFDNCLSCHPNGRE